METHYKDVLVLKYCVIILGPSVLILGVLPAHKKDTDDKQMLSYRGNLVSLKNLYEFINFILGQ